MFLKGPTIATLILCVVGALSAIPVLIQGFRRRGTGVKYERNFLVQRAPQYASLINLFFIVMSFLALSHAGKLLTGRLYLSIADALPTGIALVISCAGAAIQLSGFIFMVGGWYNLGEYFSTDAEVLNNQKVKATGLYELVMHPIYSGIIQTLLGLSITALSPLSIGITVFVVAPLWLKRARYEEKLLLTSLGDAYRQYADKMRWRRVIPSCLPLGF